MVAPNPAVDFVPLQWLFEISCFPQPFLEVGLTVLGSCFLYHSAGICKQAGTLFRLRLRLHLFCRLRYLQGTCPRHWPATAQFLHPHLCFLRWGLSEQLPRRIHNYARDHAQAAQPVSNWRLQAACHYL